MKRLICLFALLLGMLPTVCGASEEVKAVALQAFKDYVAAVGTLDVQRVVPYYHEPLMFVSAAGTRALATRAEMEEWLKPVFGRMKEQGYARSDWSEFHMKLLSAGVAVVSTQTVRYKADGQELAKLGFTYILRKTKEGWQIAVLVGHDPANVLRLD